MAYRNLLNLQLGDVASARFVAFKAIRDFLTSTGAYSGAGPGWTLVSSYYAVSSSTISDNDWIRISTPGELGIDYYEIVIKVVSTGFRCFTGFAFTGTGTNNPSYGKPANNNTYDVLSNAAGPVWKRLYIYADLDFVHIIVTDGLVSQPERFGIATCLIPEQPREVDTLVSAVTAGSSKVLTMTNNTTHPYWIVGAKIQIFDATSAECSLITAVDTGAKTITVDTLTYGYAAGAKLCTLFPYYLDTGNTKSGGTLHTLTISLAATGTVANPTYFGGNSPGPQALLTDSVKNIWSGRWPATPLCIMNMTAATSGFYLKVNNAFYMKKQPIECAIFTHNGDTYRYFGAYSETLYGFAFKEV